MTPFPIPQNSNSYSGDIGMIGHGDDKTGYNNNKSRLIQLNLQTDINHMTRVKHPIPKRIIIIIDSNSNESGGETTLTYYVDGRKRMIILTLLIRSQRRGIDSASTISRHHWIYTAAPNGIMIAENSNFGYEETNKFTVVSSKYELVLFSDMIQYLLFLLQIILVYNY